MKRRNTLSFNFLVALALLAGATTVANAQQSRPVISQGRAQEVSERGRTIAPITPSSQLQVSGKLAGKMHMVITFLETKSAYSRGASREEFVRNALRQIYPAPIPPWLEGYLFHVYDYHARGMSPDAVYAAEDGRAFSELHNAIAKTYKAGMTKREFEAQLISGATPGYGDPPQNKPWWVNFIRKAVDLIDDAWPD